MITEDYLQKAFEAFSRDIREQYYPDAGIEDINQIDKEIAYKMKVLIQLLASQVMIERK